MVDGASRTLYQIVALGRSHLEVRLAVSTWSEASYASMYEWRGYAPRPLQFVLMGFVLSSRRYPTRPRSDAWFVRTRLAKILSASVAHRVAILNAENMRHAHDLRRI